MGGRVSGDTPTEQGLPHLRTATGDRALGFTFGEHDHIERRSHLAPSGSVGRARTTCLPLSLYRLVDRGTVGIVPLPREPASAGDFVGGHGTAVRDESL